LFNTRLAIQSYFETLLLKPSISGITSHYTDSQQRSSDPERTKMASKGKRHGSRGRDSAINKPKDMTKILEKTNICKGRHYGLQQKSHFIFSSSNNNLKLTFW
jgi:hypothetical protein